MDLYLNINNKELFDGLETTIPSSILCTPPAEMRRIIRSNLMKILGTEKGTLTLVDSNGPYALPSSVRFIVFGQISYIQYYTMTAAIPGPRFDKIEYKKNRYAQAEEIFGKWTDLP